MRKGLTENRRAALHGAALFYLEMTTATSELLSTSDAARRLGVAADTVRLWNRQGRLPAMRIAGGRGIRIFRAEDVDRLAASRAEGANPQAV